MFASVPYRWLTTLRLVVGFMLLGFAAITADPALGQPATIGKWDAVFDWPNVGIHVHVLPNGKILFWGRREVGQGLDVQETTPRIWDGKTRDKSGFQVVDQPKTKKGEKYNLFCSGHTFLPDGKLLVVGGHISDTHGAPQASTFDYTNNTWTALDPMNAGRWYPTAVTLPDGGVLVISGTKEDGQFNTKPQVWKANAWTDSFDFNDIPYFPRMHVESNGAVFMSGPLNLTQSLKPGMGGGWTVVGKRNGGDGTNTLMEYGSAVMYDKGKVLFIGGFDAPINAVKKIDLDGDRVWKDAKPMNFHRRQHNATILPDGTILVTGGTQGAGFNNLTPGQPIHSAELFNPADNTWTKMAREDVDRCYHSTAVLLPDARVLSAGGGEYRPNNNVPDPNPPKDSHRNAQIFSPPYLFRGGVRPKITSAPDTVAYNTTFAVETTDPAKIDKVTWVRLSSVTHSFNMNQRINVLPFVVAGAKLTVTAPLDQNVCPPGHYMLFVLNKDKVPSEAKIVKIQ